MIEISLLSAVFFLFVLLVSVEIRRGIRHNNKMRQQDDVIRRLQSDIHALCAGAVNMGNHLSVLEQKMRRLAERLEQSYMRDPEQQTYAHAIRLAQQGVEVSVLTESCGLAQGEAELLLRLHRAHGRQAVSS
jgi:Protein of unknown function (DUF2802)